MWGLPANRRVHGRNMKGLKIACLVTGVSRKGWSWKIPSGRETVCVHRACPVCLQQWIRNVLERLKNTLWVSSGCLLVCVGPVTPPHLQQPGEEGTATITTTCSALGHLNMFLPGIPAA